MDQGRLGTVSVKNRREEIEREGGRGSVTSAITSSEMHLDRVSICQNKAASTAASLMAMDVSDRGGGEMVGWHLHIQRDTQDCSCRRAHTHTHTHTQTHTHANTTAATAFFARSRSHQSFDTKFPQSNTVIAIELLSCLCVFARVCRRALEYVSVCVRAPCVHCYLPTVFLVVRYLLPSLIVMN